VATSFDKNDKSSRRAVAADVRNKQARAERRKSLTIVGACVVVALLIIGAAAYNPIKNWWDLRQFRGVDLAAIGAPATVCSKPTTKEASAAQQHVPEGSTIDYTDAPPAFGQHYPVPDPMERKLYTADDRPPLGNLVHNLEHGYSILWYDETVANDSAQMSELRGIADKLAGTGNLRTKFKAVPWLSTDENGKKFPDGQHIAITHWSAGGTGDKATGKPVGVWQYCSAVSGEALKTFMLDYPYLDSPEPSAA
jgi:hypothetical protein